MNRNLRAWLILANAYVRTSRYRMLAGKFGDAASIVRQSAAVLGDAGLSDRQCDAIRSPDEQRLRAELEWLEGDSRHVLTLDDSDYPELLRQIPDPPLLLYVHGDPRLIHLPALAIVGSRNPTSGGTRNAFEFARHLGRSGFSIVSGLAQGIDTAAHQGALDGGRPTIAVLGNGIDRVYPAVNHALAHSISEHGALISEVPLGTHPERRLFPERNRLISGLSLGTLVVEAAGRSGSLITARLSAEQGREVFALPGSIHNPLARGCHQLIRQGAKLVETADDIVAELAPLTGHVLQSAVESTKKAERAIADDSEYVELLKCLSHDPLGAGEIVEQSGLTIDRVSSMLLLLELEGKVEKTSGGRYSLLA